MPHKLVLLLSLVLNASVGTPVFFSHHVAVLPVYLFRHGIKNLLLDVYHTVDGGRTWHYLPFHFSRQELLATDFVTPTTGFILEGIGATERSRLYRTTDGGPTWHLLPSSLSG